MMGIDDIYRQFIADIQLARWQEWVSTATQILSVWYARKNNVLVYPTGIIGVVLASYVYFALSNPPLYADALLNVYYFVMSVYGWYNWALQKEGAAVYPITWCSNSERWIGLGAFAAFWASIYLILINFTNSNTPVLDAMVSASAAMAMWWMAKRKIENWLAWTVSNLVAIPLNFYKGFMLFTLMYILFLVMAWMGYQTWKKNYDRNNGR